MELDWKPASQRHYTYDNNDNNLFMAIIQVNLRQPAPLMLSVQWKQPYYCKTDKYVKDINDALPLCNLQHLY